MLSAWTKSSLPLLLASAPLLAAYGDTVTVEVKLGTVISPGWVIVNQQLSGPRIYNPKFPTKIFMTLKHLDGAPVGEEVEILGQSPVPAGWVIVKTSGNTGVDRFTYNIRYRIRNTVVPAGAAAAAAPPVTEAPLDLDLAGIDWKLQDAYKKAQAAEGKSQADAAKAAKEKKAKQDAAAAKKDAQQAAKKAPSAPPLLEPVQPLLGWIYPAGGQRGTTIEVTIEGAFIKQPQEVLFYRPGIRCVELKSLASLPEPRSTIHGGFIEDSVQAKLQIDADCPL